MYMKMIITLYVFLFTQLTENECREWFPPYAKNTLNLPVKCMEGFVLNFFFMCVPEFGYPVSSPDCNEWGCRVEVHEWSYVL
ncbi:hypothetical protein WA026_018959 [Henosepilachna vigintioctopunctata]|uniref:Uncharacterized protein n=1 Tax=Henosepilachna vigintioctopunctata TaxID=420089 RepID=A0AAW1ULM7_9CUCU